MIQRSAFGLLLISLLFGMVAADALIARWMPLGSQLLEHGSFIPPLVAAVAVLACRELDRICRRMGIIPYTRWASACCVLLVLAPWFSVSGVLGEGILALEPYHLQIAILAASLIAVGLVAVVRQDVTGGLPAVACTWFMVGYAGMLFSFICMLRCDAHIPGHLGAWVVLMVLVVCKSSDIAAYFVGSWFGRHRLCPALSPGKSVEGLIGAIAGGIAASLLFLLIQRTVGPVEELQSLNATNTDTFLSDGLTAMIFDATFLFNRMSLMQAIVFGAFMAIFGHLGDLLESLLKRSAGVKDSGALIPGFGGILDMIDSPVVAAPIAWFLLTRVWNVL